MAWILLSLSLLPYYPVTFLAPGDFLGGSEWSFALAGARCFIGVQHAWWRAEDDGRERENAKTRALGRQRDSEKKDDESGGGRGGGRGDAEAQN